MDGILLVDKEKGVTSFDVVREIRKITNIKSVGHTGTLDPLATGLLIVLIGRATSLSDYLMNKDKIYITDIVLGVKTSTYDMEGDIIFSSKPDIHIDDIKDNICKLAHIETQKPPMYSAIKVNGKKLYEFARKNVNIDVDERKIKVYSIDVLNYEDNILRLKIHCSKGTYIRSLANDLGDMLGCGAAICELRRIQNGNFFVDNSVKIKNLTKDNLYDFLISPENALMEYDAVKLSYEFNKKLLNGVPIFLNIEDGCYRVYVENEFWGFGKVLDRKLKIIKSYGQIHK